MVRDSEASRVTIVVAVWHLIAHGGIEAVTFRRVAEQAGVSVGRVQHHFGSRDQLVREACVAMVEGAAARYRELPGDPYERLEHILTHAVPDSPEVRFGTSVWYAYLAKAVDDELICELLARTKRGAEDECVALLEAARWHQAVGGGADPRLLARRLLALADGLALRVLVGDLSGAEARQLLAAELSAAVTSPVA